MKRVIVVMIVVILALYSLPNIYAGYNVHQKVEAEKEYKRITKLIDNIEEALENMDKFKKEIETENSGDIIFFDDGSIILDYWETDGEESIEIEICAGVTDLIRDEFKVLLQKHVKELKEQRAKINVK